MSFAPLTNYAGYQHVLQAAACFVHPGNGNVYFCACEQLSGTKQNLSVYRSVLGGPPELVRRYQGTVDSVAQITMGGCVIGLGGALIVATSLIIPGVPRVTQTGFVGSYIREPGVDAPWGLASLATRLDAIEAALGSLSQGGLDAGDREALDRLRAMLRI